ncbi:hypothetical protein [Dysgonomonas sp.]
MEINISGIFINSAIDLSSSLLKTELDYRYNDMLLFENKSSKAKIATAYQGEKNRFSIFWQNFGESTFIIAELHPKQDILENLSRESTILSFRISDQKGIYIIKLFENGKLARRKIWCNPSFGLYNHFMKVYSEIGRPLDVEVETGGRASVLNVLNEKFGISIDKLQENTMFNRLTYKADKKKMAEWLKEYDREPEGCKDV